MAQGIGVPVPICILIADDQVVSRFGLCRALDGLADMLVVAEAGEGRGACAQAEALQPDVIVLELDLPGLNGVEVIRRLRERGSTAGMLILTSRRDADAIQLAKQAGADGYLSKTSSLDVIVRTIRSLASGQKAFPEGSNGLGDPARAVKTARPTPGDLGLSKRELEVLSLTGRGQTNKAIARELSISDRTVQTHLTRIYHKLGVTSRTEATLRAIVEGWISPPDSYEI